MKMCKRETFNLPACARRACTPPFRRALGGGVATVASTQHSRFVSISLSPRKRTKCRRTATALHRYGFLCATSENMSPCSQCARENTQVYGWFLINFFFWSSVCDSRRHEGVADTFRFCGLTRLQTIGLFLRRMSCECSITSKRLGPRSGFNGECHHIHQTPATHSMHACIARRRQTARRTNPGLARALVCA